MPYINAIINTSWTLANLNLALQGVEALGRKFIKIDNNMIPNEAVFQKLRFDEPSPTPDILFILANEAMPDGRTLLWSGQLAIEGTTRSVVACR